MSALADRLRRLITEAGPIPVSTFMAEALGHRTLGYYPTRDPLGAAGDFTTAPEISQVFGELIGLWAVVVWHSMGAPATFRLIELGPGRGTLMADFLRAAARADPAFATAADLHLVETSPVLREKQASSLACANPSWHDDLTTVPAGPAILIANEFFDALPIRQLVWRGGAWHERLIDLGPDGFTYTTSALPTPLATAIPRGLGQPEEDAIFEINPAGEAIANAIGHRLAAEGGAALIVDYSHAVPGLGDTLQAVAGHAYADPLAAPGEADLTAHVDFAALSAALTRGGAAVRGVTSQRDFLLALGIETRRDRLVAAARPDQATDIASGVARLIAPDQMGTLFKILAATHPDMATTPGFDTPAFGA